MTAIETIPNAFWSALNNQNLTDLLPPRWSILVNDAGVQCTLYWESSDAAPPSPPPSPDLYTSKSSLMRVKRPATQQMANAVAKRIRPNPCRSTFSTGQLTNLIQAGRNPLVPINSPFDTQTLEKKFNSGAALVAGLEHLDPDRSRQNAITNLSQAIQQQLNSAQLRNSIECLQNPNRSIIKMNNTGLQNGTNGSPSKSSTPLTEIPTPKSVIQPNVTSSEPKDCVGGESSGANIDDENQTEHPQDGPASEIRNSVVRSVGVDETGLEPSNEVLTHRRSSKSVISDSLGNVPDSLGNLESSQTDNTDTVPSDPQTQSSHFATNGQTMLNPSDGRVGDEDDINLAQLAQHKISSIVQNAVQNVTADALRNAAASSSAISSLSAVQSGHQVIQAQMAHAAQMAQQAQHQAQQVATQVAQINAQNTSQQSNDPRVGVGHVGGPRTDAEILKDNIQNMKQEDIDSDCELVETDIDNNKNGAQNNLVNVRMQNSAMVHRPLTFDPPTSMLGQLPIQSRTGSIGSLSLPSVFESRPVVSTSQNVIGNRVGVSGNSRVPITSVDKLAEQNGHKAELQALRQEANRGDEYLSMSRFVRTLSKIIFEPGELMVDSVKDIDKNKIAILLTETQRWYRANMAEVRQTLSIRLSEIRKSKRAAHWQTGRAQVMTQAGWQFPQNGTMPRYMNDSRYFSLGANPIALDAARQRNGLALPDAANFTHIPNEMDA